MTVPGRSCPAGYRYRVGEFRDQAAEASDTLYVVGGLYGNGPALDVVEELARAEHAPVTIVFNGDFNWFNVDPASYQHINQRVLAHAAVLGNVEYELALGDGSAGCGCAYPESVDDATVARSNEIHARLYQTAVAFPAIGEALRQLPRLRKFQVGDVYIGIVHGDAESLAGWRFSHDSLDDPMTLPWLEQAFHAADVDGLACSHTCLPVCRNFNFGNRSRFVINNGAAGMPNFAGTRFGVITRIGLRSSPHPRLYGLRLRGAFIDALAVDYDQHRWTSEFLANWPAGSAAWTSYWQRLIAGPRHSPAEAAPY